MKGILHYETDVRIDESSLDIEWLEQADLALRYGRFHAQCKKKLAIAEEKIKVIRAELVEEAYLDPNGCLGKGIKPSAQNVEAYYRNHEKHKAAKEEWIQAQYECDMAEIAKNEISFTRKAALENLVKLYLGNYFAGPRVPRDLIAEMRKRKEEDSKKANDIVGSSEFMRTRK